MTVPTQPSGWAATLLAMWGVRQLQAWGQWMMAAAMLTVLSLTPSVLHQQRHGRLSRDIVKTCWPLWPMLLLTLGALMGVLFGLAFDAAAPLGLTALVAEVVVRVVILELAPLMVATAVLIKVSLPQTSHLRRRARQNNQVLDAWDQGLHIEALPRFLASFFMVILSVVSLTVLLFVLTYLQLHGFNRSGLGAFTNWMGSIFEPALVLAWLVKLFLLAWCVSLLPMATLLVPSMAHEHNADLQLKTLIRVVLILLGIKLLSLSATYA